MKATTVRRALALACAAATLCVPVTASGASEPEAQTARKCRPATTLNGGRVNFINTSGRGLTCRTARRVARRANGRRYKAFGFNCKPSGRATASGRLYGCGGVIGGRAQGIGFFYKRPTG